MSSLQSSSGLPLTNTCTNPSEPSGHSSPLRRVCLVAGSLISSSVSLPPPYSNHLTSRVPLPSSSGTAAGAVRRCRPHTRRASDRGRSRGGLPPARTRRSPRRRARTSRRGLPAGGAGRRAASARGPCAYREPPQAYRTLVAACGNSDFTVCEGGGKLLCKLAEGGALSPRGSAVAEGEDDVSGECEDGMG